VKAVVLVALGALVVVAMLNRDRAAPEVTVETAGCRPGFVWRQAGPDDAVCVGFLSRDRIALENRLAASRRTSDTATCRDGLVWREAFAGDTTCVTPWARKAVRIENALTAAQQLRSTRQTAISPERGLSAAPAAR
jgi:hypothetical protein